MKKINVRIRKKTLIGFIDTWHSWCGNFGRNCINNCGEGVRRRCKQAKKTILALLRGKNAKK